MSAEAFIALFRRPGDDRTRLYREWKSKNRTWVNYNREELVGMGLSKRVGFVLSEVDAKGLGEQALANFKLLVSDLKKTDKPPKRGPYVTNIDGTDVVLFPGVDFEKGIYKTLDKYLGKGTSETARNNNLVRGHIYGINTGALIGVKESLLRSGAFSGLDSEKVSEITKFIDILIEHLEKMDIDSSNLKNYSSPIFAKYTKSSRHFLVELQTKEGNDASAKLVQKLAGRTEAASTGIRGIFTPGGSQEKALLKLLDILKQQGFTGDQVTSFKGSPSMKELIVDEVIDAIGGSAKRKYSKKYTLNNTKVGSITRVYVNEAEKSSFIKEVRDTKNKLKQLKIAAASKLKQVAVSIPNISSLEALLRGRLHDQIKRNMGTGNAQNVLNYRTGRFAKSASIERISTSRTGMVSVFYNYMRNPYGTFSAGGRQEYPKTRDPKLLISKSIREIAAEAAVTRLRSVLV